MRRDLASIVAMAGMLVVSQVIALLLAPIFLGLNFQAFPDASNPVNPLLYILLILAFTAVILLLVRYRKRNLAKYVILGSIFFTIAFVFVVPLYLATYWWMGVDLAGNVSTIGAFLLAILIVYALYKYPEWSLVDTVGIAIAAGVTAVLGISFSILPAFLLLLGLAVYDAWAVYRSKHMVTLADEMTSQKLPILLVVPKKASYSYLEQKSLKEQIATGLHGSRAALDAIPVAIREHAPDLFLACGDITHFGKPASYVEDLFRRITTKALAVPGNCDPPALVGVLDGLGVNLHMRKVK